MTSSWSIDPSLQGYRDESSSVVLKELNCKKTELTRERGYRKEEKELKYILLRKEEKKFVAADLSVLKNRMSERVNIVAFGMEDILKGNREAEDTKINVALISSVPNGSNQQEEKLSQGLVSPRGGTTRSPPEI